MLSLCAVEHGASQVDDRHSLPTLQFATTMPPIVPLPDDDYEFEELYEPEEQFGKAGEARIAASHLV